MRRRPDVRAGLALAVALAGAAAAEPAREAPKSGGGLFDPGSFSNRKDPITVTADSLEYDYKANVVVYHGDVLAIQGDTKVRSDTLTVTFASRDGAPNAPQEPDGKDSPKLQQVVAVGNVRIDNGTRWATGGRAVFEQGKRTLVLTESPVMHDGPNEVLGDRVIVYLDENRSVVEGGRKRVKAVVYPGKDDGLAPARKDGAVEASANGGAREAGTP
jgi:lipopolysaccharide export system protein LptA